MTTPATDHAAAVATRTVRSLPASTWGPVSESPQALPPGATLNEWFIAHGSTYADMARELNISVEQVEKILLGLTVVTAGIAVRLERLTDIPAYRWLKIESEYRADQSRRGNSRRGMLR